MTSSLRETPMISSLMNRAPGSRPRLFFVTLVLLFVTTCHEQGAEDVEMVEARFKCRSPSDRGDRAHS
jgi:hypothetical protein